MSFQLMAWATRQTVGSPTRKAVLMALANRANHDTGLCCPSIEAIATETEYGERAVRQALSDLCENGPLERDRQRRGDGSWSVYHYRFPAEAWNGSAPHAQPPAADAAGPPAGGAGQNLEEDLNQGTLPLQDDLPDTSPSEEPVLQRDVGKKWPGSVNRKPVKQREGELAVSVLGYFNEVFATSFTAHGHVAKIIMRLREHPEIDLDGHRRIIELNQAAPWWKGDASPAVIYGNDGLFEQCMRCNGVKVARTRAERKDARVRSLLDGSLLTGASARLREAR